MSSGFVTETELEEARKKRQEEWEKVRKADDPAEAPEPEYDPRSLFDRLQEQKNKKDLEYQEAHQLKNLIKGLDDDEVEFLDIVDKNKLDAERKQQIEEKKELLEFREKVASLQEKRLDEKLQSEVAKPKQKIVDVNRISQKKILLGAVVTKRKLNSGNNENGEESKKAKVGEKPTLTAETDSKGTAGLRVIGILPGIGTYRESTESSEDTSDSDENTQSPKYDWIGRKIVKETCEN
uniref:FAM192A/Fyv6 N-terminal domain-containing protein n=1 Tax=Corethrella appendiculata TaxID=1370023 RepID=U5ETC4_9DIPT